MAYLGKGLDSLTTANITVDRMTGNGSTATMTITLANGVNSVNDISAFVSGIMQRPGTDYTLSGSTLSFTTAPANGLEVVAISHGDSVLDNVADATTITESFKDVSITDANIGGMSASKLTGALSGSGANLTTLNATTLTGALPAISGANLTNLNAANLTGALPAIDGSAITGVTGYTISASDPAINTNPSGGLGSVWSNSTSGEAYSCTDATTDANVWTNVGTGTGNIQPPQPFGGNGGGTTQGYHFGGSALNSVVGTFSFTTDGSATVSSNLAVGVYGSKGTQSLTYGYSVGGNPYSNRQSFQKMAFASGTWSSISQTGCLWYTESATTASSSTHGYSIGGANYPRTGVCKNQKHSFASDAMTLVGESVFNTGADNLVANRGDSAGHSSNTHGYAAGGSMAGYGTTELGAWMNRIEKWSFASDGNSIDAIATLSAGRGASDNGNDSGMGAANSGTHGYMMGGGGQYSATHDYNEKYAFDSSAQAVLVGDLYEATSSASSCSSDVSGYMIGGRNQPYVVSQTIQKFQFATDSQQMTSVGNLYGGGSSNLYGGAIQV